MGGAKKSTKKFEKKHLKDVLERRKGVAKIKQRQQLKSKKKARKTQDVTRIPEESSNDEKAENQSLTHGHFQKSLKDMTVDDFFQGGFDIPEPKPVEKNRPTKRKREEIERGSDSSDSENLLAGDPVASDSDFSSQQEEDAQGSEQDHEQDLQALAERDPDFYKYLQENDAELLRFKDEEALDHSAAELDELPKKKGNHTASQQAIEDADTEIGTNGVKSHTEKILSVEMTDKWRRAMTEQYSLRAMREIVLAFRAAAHNNDEGEKQFKYAIPSSEIYHQVLITALEHVPTVLGHHLPIKETKTGKIRVPTDSKKYRTLSPLLNSHGLSILHLFESLSDPPTLKLTLASLSPLLPYLLGFKKVIKNLTKAVVGVWSDSSNNEATRINAFLIIRKLTVIGDASLKEAVLKAVYQGFVKGSKNTTVHTLAGINLMKNSAAELWGLDTNLGYLTGFTYIRQLAIHIRSSISQPTKDSYKQIYNWQYTHSLDFWSRVLSTHCSPAANSAIKKPSESALHPLIYPLVQITLGAIRLIPTPVYFPLRFQLIRSLLRISRSTNTYIPLAPALIEVIQSPEMRERSKPSTQKALDFATSLRAPKSYLRTRIYQDGVGEEVSELLAEFFGIWAANIAFPELIIPPSFLLRRWLKDVSSPPGKGKGRVKATTGNGNHKLNSSIQLLLQKMAANASFVEERRTKVDFAVSDRKGVEDFLKDVDFEDLPLGAFVVGSRKLKEERERLLEESRKENERRRQEGEDMEMGDAECWSDDKSEEAVNDVD